MGFIKTPMYVQSAMVNEMLGKMVNSKGLVLYENNAPEWLYDNLLFATSEEDYFHCLNQFLEQMHREGLCLSIDESVLYATEKNYCGQF